MTNSEFLRPETMGAVCAIVYLLAIISFIPFAFYKDIVAATSGGGNRDVVVEVQHVETGRMLHRFPHGKVCYGPILLTGCYSGQVLMIAAGVLHVRCPLPTVHYDPRHWR